jgi:hypothetical protein
MIFINFIFFLVALLMIGAPPRRVRRAGARRRPRRHRLPARFRPQACRAGAFRTRRRRRLPAVSCLGGAPAGRPSVCVFRSRLLHPFSCARRLCPLPAALPANALKLVVSIGVFLLLTSIFGWVGVKYNHATCGRYTLGVYATILVILILMEWKEFPHQE